MKTLLLATTNPDKLSEMRTILEGIDIELRTLGDVARVAEPVEDGATFADNARQKALHYANATGLLTVAEDSGLEIDALGGEPSVYSSRFGGKEAPTYPEKFREIYRRLEALGARGSRARFVCALALAERGRAIFETRGTIEGQVAPEPRGIEGFGYDPIFFYPPLGRTLGELSHEEKSQVSHRGQAFRALREYLVKEKGHR